MTALWTTEELPGQRWDPEPDDDEDDGPWCPVPLNPGGQHTAVYRLANMTKIKLVGSDL